MSRLNRFHSLACVATLLLAASCGESNTGTGDGGRDGGRDEAWADGGDGTDGGDPGLDAGEGGEDGGSTGGPFATCEACAVTADCEPGSSCVSVAGGLRACVAACDPTGADPSLACPRGFACDDSFPGTRGPSCIPSGLQCCIDLDEDGFGQGVHCRALDCDDSNRQRNPAAAERCNGVDDDCDGIVPADEADADGDGFRVCDGDCDDDSDTVFPGGSEICNGKDDDCDGVVPANEADADRDGVRICQTDCDDTDPLVKPGAEQRCNGRDDACTGSVPENEADADGDGYRACDGDCDDRNADVHPGATEVCNGIDDDCSGAPGDGETDADGDGVLACAGDCNDDNDTVFPGAPELCDGVDNDCEDGADDTSTTCGVGACAVTVSDCLDGFAQECIPGLPTGDETCNGEDDDCDGEVDEGFESETCGVGACERTVSRCADGASAECEPGLPVSETCNGIDDDCDGVVDDGNPGGGEACDTGLRGVCGTGVLTCTDGGVICQVVVAPGTGVELCNGLDDDCDGAVDEGSPQTGEACDTGEPGACAAGVARCSRGTLLCDRVTGPSLERCDNRDNDCNGIVDDNLGTITCGVGACQVTVAACTGGVAGTCVARAPGTEACNGIDDDCDGTVDEGQAGIGVACSTGLPGICGTGVAYCGVNDFSCTPNVNPGSQAEQCDGLDNDCDGLVDEGNPGGGVACNTGRPGTCAAGVLSCRDGGLTCVPTVATGPEVCDGIDNDCDGQIDEGLGTISCGIGLCARTVPACIAGTPGTCTAAAGSVETCNGIDDNCDGIADNGAISVMCPAPNNVTGSQCNAGVCSFTGCVAPNVDADGVYGNGCECEEDTVGSSSAAPTNLGTLGAGGFVFGPAAVVPTSGQSDWYYVAFPLNAVHQTRGSGAPRITFTQNSAGTYRFEVYENGLGNRTCAAAETWTAEDNVAPQTGTNYFAGASNPDCVGNWCASTNQTGVTCPASLVSGAYDSNRSFISNQAYCGCNFSPHIPAPIGTPAQTGGQVPGYFTRADPIGCTYQFNGQSGEGTWGLRQRAWPAGVWIRVFRTGGRGCERYQLRVSR